MAKGIATGIEKIVAVFQNQQTNELQANWRDLRNKLDSLLLSNNVLKTDEAIKACHKLDSMTLTERRQHILSLWGPLYTQRCEPLLLQLDTLEKYLYKSEEKSES